ncbi:translation elongation factor Ts [Myxococcota bacterium]|nr:translation elongation factor Ts [Myxococcota bacterium]
MAQISAKQVKDLRDQTGAGMMDCKRALNESDGDLAKAVAVLRERGLAKAGKREGRATSEGVIAISLRGGSGGMVELGCETDFVARTDQFNELASSLSEVVAQESSISTPDDLLLADVGGQKIGDRIAEAIATLGENVVVKRVKNLSTDGIVGGYVHAGGKLGVLVALSGGTDEQESLAKDVAMHVAAADPTPAAVDRDGLPAELIESETSIYRNQAESEGKPEGVIDKIVTGKLSKFVASVCLVDQPFVKDPDRKVGDLLTETSADLSVAAFERFKLGEVAES